MPGSLLEELTLRVGPEDIYHLSATGNFVKEECLRAFARTLYERRQQLQERHYEDLDGEESSRLSGFSKLRLIAFPSCREARDVCYAPRCLGAAVVPAFPRPSFPAIILPRRA